MRCAQQRREQSVKAPVAIQRDVGGIFAATLKSVGVSVLTDGTTRFEAAMVEITDGPPVIVLLAEDETLVRLLASDVLTDADYRVVEAHDGQEALTILSSYNTVRALVTDVTMPNVDGLALAKIVRERWPHIGVLVTSGRPMPSDLPNGARFISKPYRHESMLEQLEAVIAETAHMQASPTRLF